MPLQHRNNGETFTVLAGNLTLQSSNLNPSEEALWLAASFTPTPYQTILDAGCGTGIVGLSLLKRCPTLKLTGIDCDHSALQQARHNADINNLPYTTHAGDFMTTQFEQPFDHVVANLPFHALTRGFTTPNPRKHLAYALPKGTLTTWLDNLWKNTAQQMHILLHTAEALAVEAWAQENNQPFACTFLVTHPKRLPKRVIFHIGQASSCRMIPTYQPDLRQHILYDGHAL